MALEFLRMSKRNMGNISLHLTILGLLLIALILGARSHLFAFAGHSVEAIGAEGESDPMPQHSIPFAHWDVFDGDGTDPPEYFWGKDDYKPRAGGDYSACCARDGASGRDPENWLYSSNANSWMVYGPFSLEFYTEAVLEFWYWNRSEDDPFSEFDYFSWTASIDNNLFFGTQG